MSIPISQFIPPCFPPDNHKFVFCICDVYLFIYFWLLWVFIAARGLLLVAASRGYSVVHGLLITVASLVAEHGL